MTADPTHAITQGRACVRLIEADDALLESESDPMSATALSEARQVCVTQLRAQVATLPPDVTTQVMAASEEITGPVAYIPIHSIPLYYRETSTKRPVSLIAL